MHLRLLLLAAVGFLAACGEEPAGKMAAPPPRAHLVELAQAVQGQLSYAADRAGSLRALREVRIVNQEDGEITAVTVREGDRVRKGQLLVRYDDRILQAQLDKALATEKQTEIDLRRNRQLIEKGFIGADALSRAETALAVARAESRLLRARVQNLTIEAPFAGVISHRLIEPGGVTPQHTHLLTLLDPSQLVTDVSVSELVLPNLDVGDPATVRIDALNNAAFEGRVLRIHPSIDPATRTGMVEVTLAPAPKGARPGQFCRVEFHTIGREQLLVPLAAVRRDEKGEFVYVYADDGTVQRAGVTSGLRLADKVEIRSGIDAGTRVVTKGFIGLAPGQRVKPVDGPPG